MSLSLTQLLVILVIVVLLFGTKRLGNIGADLGNAIKGFKKSMKEETDADEANKQLAHKEQPPIDSTAQVKKEEPKV